MRRLSLCAVILLVASFRQGLSRELLARTCPTNNPSLRSGKIANGFDSMSGRYPYMVSLKNFQGNHFCGGMLIDKDLVLTAAHCVDPNAAGTVTYPRVEIGATRASDDQDSEFRETCRTIVHQSYNYNRIVLGYDIALLELEGNSTKPPVNLYRGALEPGLTCRAMGWGYTETGERPLTLQEIDMQIVATPECERQLNDDCKAVNGGEDCNFLDSMLCAQVTDADVCKGDSGGPLVYVQGNKEDGCGKDDFLLGITSFGLGCSGRRALQFPGVYTHVSEFAEWILSRGEEGPKSVNRVIYENPDGDESKCSRFTSLPIPKPKPKPKPNKSKRICFWRNGRWFPPGCRRSRRG